MSSWVGIKRSDMVRRAGDEETLLRYAKGDDSNIDDAIEKASDRFLSAAESSGYVLAELTTLTPETIPGTPKTHIVSLAIEELTSSLAERPAIISEKAASAETYLERLSEGRESITGLNRATATAGDDIAGHERSEYRMPRQRVFDPSNAETVMRTRKI